MESVDPSLVIQAVVDKLNANKVALGISSAIEISEDPSSTVKPPYVGVFANTEQPAIENAMEGMPISIPIEIICLIFSKEHRTASESMKSAWAIARAMHPIVRGAYQIDVGAPGVPDVKWIALAPSQQKPPLEIQRKAADSSIVAVNLQYLNPSYE